MQVASRQPLWDGRSAGGRTVLWLRVTSSARRAEIAVGMKCAEFRSVAVDWGDGTADSVSEIARLAHEYGRTGDYRVVISDALATFGYADPETPDATRQMLLELESLGTRVTAIPYGGFNNCRSMRGRIVLPGVTDIGSYAFGSVGGVSEFVLPSVRYLRQESFYTCPSAGVVFADAVERIDSMFVSYYGSGRLCDLYVRGRTCGEVRAMTGFPFGGRPEMRFHCGDGILLGNGTVT